MVIVTASANTHKNTRMASEAVPSMPGLRPSSPAVPDGFLRAKDQFLDHGPRRPTPMALIRTSAVTDL